MALTALVIILWTTPQMYIITLAFWQHVPLYEFAIWLTGYVTHLLIKHAKIERIEDVTELHEEVAARG